MTGKEFVVIGQLGRPRGVRGEINVTPLTDFPERFLGMTELWVDERGEWRLMKLVSSRMVAGKPALLLDGICNPEDARRMTNKTVAVTKDDVVELPQGSYYVFDLIGCQALDAGGGLLGEIVNVESYPANDAWEIRTTAGKTVALAAIWDYVKSVDINARKVTVDPAGFVEY